MKQINTNITNVSKSGYKIGLAHGHLLSLEKYCKNEFKCPYTWLFPSKFINLITLVQNGILRVG